MSGAALTALERTSTGYRVPRGRAERFAPIATTHLVQSHDASHVNHEHRRLVRSRRLVSGEIPSPCPYIATPHTCHGPPSISYNAPMLSSIRGLGANEKCLCACCSSAGSEHPSQPSIRRSQSILWPRTARSPIQGDGAAGRGGGEGGDGGGGRWLLSISVACCRTMWRWR